jgi:hypothetical protein
LNSFVYKEKQAKRKQENKAGLGVAPAELASRKNN